MVTTQQNPVVDTQNIKEPKHATKDSHQNTVEGNKKEQRDSADAEKAFGKTQPPFMIKTVNKVVIEGTYLNVIKAIYDRTIACIIPKRPKAFPLRSETKEGCPLSER